VNEKLKKRLNRFLRNVESRTQTEKLFLLAISVAVMGLGFLTYVYEPLQTDINSQRNQLNSVATQISSQQAGYLAKLAESLEDPDKFANDRLQAVNKQQQSLISEIANLAGDLVTPNLMTAILSSVLGRQTGLALVSFKNEEAKPLRANAVDIVNGVAEAGSLGVSDDVAGQVYEHGITIELEGDFFNTLRYLRFLEDISGSFFWDSVTFEQTDWPNALVTLKIHTLSTEKGFIGV
jgi:MSHA biogenesis protein MshJ